MKILGILTGWRAARKKGSDSAGGGEGLNWTNLLLKMNISSELDFFKIMVYIFLYDSLERFHDNSLNCCPVEN